MKSWLRNLKQIYDGWKNDAFPTTEIINIAEQRAKICAGCPLNVNGTCSTSKTGIVFKDFIYKGELRHEGQEVSGCGCPLSKKTKSLDSKCPINRW